MPLEGRRNSATATATGMRNKAKIPQPPQHAEFHFGFCEDPNVRRRRRMEDSHAFFYDFNSISNCGFFAIYDGHGGKSAADWCGANLHRVLQENWTRDPNGSMPQILDRTFMECDENLDPAHGIFSGCTAIVSIIVPDAKDPQRRTLYSANVGDARAVLCRRGKAVRLSFDHQARVPQEKQRIKECGGIVINDRVNGTLAVTRALGDASMKEFITGHPFTTETRLLPSHQDTLLILACDGLWDVCTDQEACDYIQNEIDDPQRCAELLVDFALEQGSTDNLSVIVIRLGGDGARDEESVQNNTNQDAKEDTKEDAKEDQGDYEDQEDQGDDDKITHHDPHQLNRE